MFGRKKVDFSNLDVTWIFLKLQVFADSVNLLMVCKRTLEPFASKTVGFGSDFLHKNKEFESSQLEKQLRRLERKIAVLRL